MGGVLKRSNGPCMCLALVMAVAMATSSGCALALVGAAAGAGAGGIAYAKGDIERTYPYPIDVVSEACVAALGAAEVNVTHLAHDQLSARIEAGTASGDKIKIVLGTQGSVTALKLRVNTFGDKPLSQSIIARIDSYLLAPYAIDHQPQYAPLPTVAGPEFLPVPN